MLDFMRVNNVYLTDPFESFSRDIRSSFDDGKYSSTHKILTLVMLIECKSHVKID